MFLVRKKNLFLVLQQFPASASDVHFEFYSDGKKEMKSEEPVTPSDMSSKVGKTSLHGISMIFSS